MEPALRDHQPVACGTPGTHHLVCSCGQAWGHLDRPGRRVEVPPRWSFSFRVWAAAVIALPVAVIALAVSTPYGMAAGLLGLFVGLPLLAFAGKWATR